MKRWIGAILAVLALAAVAFTSGMTPQQPGVVDTPEAEASYTAAACYAAEHGLPPPPPLRFTNGGSMMVACDVNSA